MIIFYVNIMDIELSLVHDLMLVAFNTIDNAVWY